jgi:hypothetical protein
MIAATELQEEKKQMATKIIVDDLTNDSIGQMLANYKNSLIKAIQGFTDRHLENDPRCIILVDKLGQLDILILNYNEDFRDRIAAEVKRLKGPQQ